jgi:carbon monoxide dehydrogenase subunit G
LRLKVRPDIGGHAIVVALIDLTEASATSSSASWRTSTELDPMLAVLAGQRVEEFLRTSIDHLIAGLAS